MSASSSSSQKLRHHPGADAANITETERDNIIDFITKNQERPCTACGKIISAALYFPHLRACLPAMAEEQGDRLEDHHIHIINDEERLPMAKRAKTVEEQPPTTSFSAIETTTTPILVVSSSATTTTTTAADDTLSIYDQCSKCIAIPKCTYSSSTNKDRVMVEFTMDGVKHYVYVCHHRHFIGEIECKVMYHRLYEWSKQAKTVDAICAEHECGSHACRFRVGHPTGHIHHTKEHHFDMKRAQYYFCSVDCMKKVLGTGACGSADWRTERGEEEHRDYYDESVESPADLLLNETDEIFEQIVGLDRNEFAQLCSLFNLAPWNALGSGRKHMLDTHHALLLVLIWLRQYWTLNVFVWLFQRSQSTVQQTLDAALHHLHSAVAYLVSWGTIQSRQQQGAQYHNRIITCVMDGFTQNCFRSSVRHVAEFFYSGHVKDYAVRSLLITSPSGKIYAHSRAYPGCFSDMSVVKMMDFVQFVRTSTDLVQDSFLADAGFEGADQTLNRSVFISRHRGHQEGDPNLTTVRAVVENVIAQLRCWRILSERIRTKVGDDMDYIRERYNIILDVVCALYNLFRHVR